MFKILVVEDKSLIRRGIISMIDWTGNSCQLIGEAENGKEAIKLINALHPDLVITDIKMPLLDGLSLLDYIIDSGKTIKTIVISGYDNFEYARHAIHAQSVDYLLKPVHPEALNKAIATACLQLSPVQPPDVPNSQKSIQTLLQHALRSVDYRTLGDILPLFDMPFHPACFCVAVFTNKYNIYDGFEEKLMLFCPTDICLYGIDNHISFVVLILFQNTTAYPEIRRVLKNFHSTLSGSEQTGCYIGISRILSNDARLHEGKEQALSALCYKLLLPHQTLLEFSILEKKQTTPSDLFCKEKQLLDYLVSGNGAAAEKFCHNAIRQYVDESGNIKSLCVLLLQLYCLMLQMNTSYTAEIETQMNQVNHTAYILSFDNLEQFLQPLYRFCNLIASETLARNNNDIISSMRIYLQKHFAEEISLKSLEHIFHLNASYLSALFKKENGIGINRYLTQLRLEYAENLLNNTNYKLNEIAEKCGFPNYIHFSKIFKAYFGLSPSEYRKKIISDTSSDTW